MQQAPLTAAGYYEGRSLIEACGKFLVLSKMLMKLKEQGHRVLIFSQVCVMSCTFMLYTDPDCVTDTQRGVE